MVSVIVPVYNNEKYIGRCLESLLCQDYRDYEIIVVNDGSTDGSVEKIKAINSDRIRLFTIENSGPSAARNYGISKCNEKSDYLFFVDSDDTVTNNYLSSMLRYASNDCLVLSYINFANENYIGNTIEKADSKGTDAIALSTPLKQEEFYKHLINGRLNPLWNKCFSLKLIREHKLSIPHGFPEDTRFCLHYLGYCRQLIIIPDMLYNYIKRPGSVTGKGYAEIYDNYMAMQQELYDVAPLRYHCMISEYVYPQYVANTKKFIRAGDYSTPAKYLKSELVRRAISEHESTCIGDAIIKFCMKYKLLSLLSHM